VVTAAEVVLVAALARTATQAPFSARGGELGFLRHLPDQDPVHALVFATHRVALAGAVWLLATTVLSVAAVSVRRPRLVRASVALTTPALRRLVAAAVLSVGTLGPVAAAGAAEEPPPSVAVRDGRAVAVSATGDPGPAVRATPAVVPTDPDSPTPTGTGVVVPTDPDSATDSPTATATGAGGATVSVTVAPGDSLWELTRAALARESGRAPVEVGNDEVAPRWLLVCEANQSRVRSGDVDLLAPGEEVVIPAG
jgi:hypothetical protein